MYYCWLLSEFEMTFETALEKVGAPTGSSKSGLVWAERRLLRAGQVASKNGFGKPTYMEKTQLHAALITCFQVRPTARLGPYTEKGHSVIQGSADARPCSLQRSWPPRPTMSSAR